MAECVGGDAVRHPWIHQVPGLWGGLGWSHPLRSALGLGHCSLEVTWLYLHRSIPCAATVPVLAERRRDECLGVGSVGTPFTPCARRVVPVSLLSLLLGHSWRPWSSVTLFSLPLAWMLLPFLGNPSSGHSLILL